MGCRQHWQEREPNPEKDNDYSTLTATSDTSFFHFFSKKKLNFFFQKKMACRQA
jgi:hypothetical protein